MLTDPHLFFSTLFLLLFGHCLADFPLQGDFLARLKNRKDFPEKNLWLIGIFAHSMIHGGIVFILTGQLLLSITMLFTHAAIDTLKCEGSFGEGAKAFWIDQILHVWVIVMIAVQYST